MVDSRVARDAQGRPLASPEIVVVATLPTHSDRRRRERHGPRRLADGVRRCGRASGSWRAGSSRRACTSWSSASRPPIATRARRSGRPSSSSAGAGQVVGVFSSEGSGFESEIWGDVDVMGPAFNRANGYQSLTLRLKDPSTAAAFDADLQTQPCHAGAVGGRAAPSTKSRRADGDDADRCWRCSWAW